MKLKNLVSTAAAAGLLLAPLAAQAGTSAASVPGAVGSRASASVKKSDSLNPGLTIAVVVAAGAATYGLAKAVDNNSKSRGANN